MMVFLLQDTLREHPVGFESKRRNVFDPEEDDEKDDSSETPQTTEASEDAENTKPPAQDPPADNDDAEVDENGEEKKKEPTICSRQGCSKKPRFDSLFCSDSCGVSALEGDLLRTFEYASDIHPSLLRN